jgi:type VI secretion system protein ImpC
MEEHEPKAVGIQPAEAAEGALDAALSGEVEEFRGGLRRAVPDEVRPAVEEAIGEWLGRLMRQKELVSDSALDSLEAMIAFLDEKLSEQVNLILHHPQFQELEATWRGLEHLVFGTEISEDLKIRVLNLTKEEVSKQFAKFKGARWDKSDLFKKIYGPYNTPGGQPFGVLIGDFYFNHRPVDLDIMKGMGQIAAASHAPFIAGAAPALLGQDSWETIIEPAKLGDIVQGPQWAGWRSFRQSPDARYVGLALPRFLARLPYGPDNQVVGFAFAEDCDGSDHSKYLWANSSFAMGANITQAYKFYGWCSCIRGKKAGGEVSGLKVHTFESGGTTLMKCPTEISIGEDRERELAGQGLMGLLHWQNTDTAAFLAAPSVYQPKEFDDPDATANSRLNGSLPYLFAVSRFAHLIKVMVLESIGVFVGRGPATLEKWLNDWIVQFKCTAAEPSQEDMARQPLADASVKVEEIPGEPGAYYATFHIKPIFQLERIETSLRLVTKLPREKVAKG